MNLDLSGLRFKMSVIMKTASRFGWSINETFEKLDSLTSDQLFEIAVMADTNKKLTVEDLYSALDEDIKEFGS